MVPASLPLPLPRADEGITDENTAEPTAMPVVCFRKVRRVIFSFPVMIELSFFDAVELLNSFAGEEYSQNVETCLVIFSI